MSLIMSMACVWCAHLDKDIPVFAGEDAHSRSVSVCHTLDLLEGLCEVRRASTFRIDFEESVFPQDDDVVIGRECLGRVGW